MAFVVSSSSSICSSEKDICIVSRLDKKLSSPMTYVKCMVRLESSRSQIVMKMVADERQMYKK